MVSNTAPTDYSAEAQRIERNRRLAEAMRQESASALPSGSMAGRTFVATSPLSHLAQALKASNARGFSEQADEEAKALAKTYQTDLVDVLRRGAQATAGTPGSSETIVDEQANGGEGATAQINAPAVPGDPNAAASIYMQHPATQQMGIQQLSDNAKRAAMLSALRGPQGQGGQPGGQKGGAIGGPVGGVPLEMWLQIDPTGAAYVKRLAEMGEVQGGMQYDGKGQGFVITKGGQQVPIPGATAPMDMVNVGGAVVPVNKYTQNQPIPTTMSPQQLFQAQVEQGRYSFETGQQPPSIPAPQLPGAAPAPQSAPQPRAPLPEGTYTADQLPPRAVMTSDTKALVPTASVPASDLDAFAKVSRGEVTSARGLTPGMTPKQQAEADTKAAENQPKAQLSVTSARNKAEVVSKKVDEALGKTGFFTTGLAGAGLSMIPGTPAYDLDKAIDTVKANIGFKELQEMRASSPTGGALGQIAVQEIDYLQAAIASLKQGQSEEALRNNLGAIKKHFEGWKNAVERAYQEQYGSVPGAPQASPAADNDPLGIRKRP
jgi:hypothetical protein